MGRKILFITTDQQRYDALGCNGGQVARTPTIDRWAREGLVYDRAHAQSVVCMPARATMVTGQYVRTHGVWMNGVPLPADAPSVARYLQQEAGYRTALIGKAHFEPFIDRKFQFYENRMAQLGEFGPHRGFDHMELAGHVARGLLHYSKWMAENHADEVDGFYRLISVQPEQNSHGGGDTGAVQVKHNPIERGHYHTDWVADRTIAWLDSLPADADWFCWMSFPDPHHPWDPPQSELRRVDWRELELPQSCIAGDAARRAMSSKPRHWLDWYDGRLVTNFEAPPDFVPSSVTRDQLREIHAMIHIENELIDEACARVWQRIGERGWGQDTDIVYTTDHGELQGDHGLLFKGPYHVDALMRLPMIWRPAASAGVTPGRIAAPVGQVDLAPTFCAIAGIAPGEWMQGHALPQSAQQAQSRQTSITEWDSEFKGTSMHLRTLYRDGWICTVYDKSTFYDGSEGELYDLANDPNQWRNLWREPRHRAQRDALVAELHERTPAARNPRLAAVAAV
jgi:arylsulfatase A-like enzyme